MHACRTRVFNIQAVAAPASEHPDEKSEEARDAGHPDVVSVDTPTAEPDAEHPDAASEETPAAPPVADHPDVASAPAAVPVAEHPDVASAPTAAPVAEHPDLASAEATTADDVVMTSSAPTADDEEMVSSTADGEVIPSAPTAEAEARSAAEPQAEPAAPPARMWLDLQTIVKEIEEEMRLEQASTVQLHVQLFSKVCDQFLLSGTTVLYTGNT
jgi:hypothetical protein